MGDIDRPDRLEVPVAAGASQEVFVHRVAVLSEYLLSERQVPVLDQAAEIERGIGDLDPLEVQHGGEVALGVEQDMVRFQVRVEEHRGRHPLGCAGEFTGPYAYPPGRRRTEVRDRPKDHRLIVLRPRLRLAGRVSQQQARVEGVQRCEEARDFSCEVGAGSVPSDLRRNSLDIPVQAGNRRPRCVEEEHRAGGYRQRLMLQGDREHVLCLDGVHSFGVAWDPQEPVTIGRGDAPCDDIPSAPDDGCTGDIRLRQRVAKRVDDLGRESCLGRYSHAWIIPSPANPSDGLVVSS